MTNERRSGDDPDYAGPLRRAADRADKTVIEARRLITEQQAEADRLAEERVARAAALAEEREDRAKRLAQEEADRRTALAVERTKLDLAFEHEIADARKRLDIINGNIKEQVAGLKRVEDKQDEITLELSTGRAVTVALTAQMTEWNKQQEKGQKKIADDQATKSQLKWSVIAVLVSMGGLLVAVIALLPK
jgi:hypothetical protein